MPDTAMAHVRSLNLARRVPAGRHAEWEAAIAKDLKGADYEKKLVWRTEEGLAVRPYYRAGSTSTPGVAALGECRRARLGDGAAGTRAGARRGRDPRRPAARSGATRRAGTGVRAGRRASDRLAGRGRAAVRRVGSCFAVGLESLHRDRQAARGAPAVGAGRRRRSARRRRDCRIHARTRRATNKSVYDPYTNLLRVTTEALSAVVGGCDTLTVEPFGFDAAPGAERAAHPARRERTSTRWPIPAAGSYYIEALTDALAREAWKLFQAIEAEGGYAGARGVGLARRGAAPRRARRKEKAVAPRRRVLVGVNNYPEPARTRARATAARPRARRWRLAAPFEHPPAHRAPRARDRAVRRGCCCSKRGDVKMEGARANFCLNFFGCAGFDIVAVRRRSGTDADLDRAVQLRRRVPRLRAGGLPGGDGAGARGGQPEGADRRAAGGRRAGFVHVAATRCETLTKWQDRLGMTEQRQMRPRLHRKISTVRA